MSMSDPIADMLTRIRNAHGAEMHTVAMPSSRVRCEVARLLKQEGFVRDYVVEGGDSRRTLKVYLKYNDDGEPVIKGIKRESRPGLRAYRSASDLPKVLGGMGLAIMSTSLGIMSGEEARRRGVGGEFLCSVW